jgi:hypothetical protein
VSDDCATVGANSLPDRARRQGEKTRRRALVERHSRGKIGQQAAVVAEGVATAELASERHGAQVEGDDAAAALEGQDRRPARGQRAE